MKFTSDSGLNLTLLRKMHLQTFKNIFLQQMETIYLTLTAAWPDETAPYNSKDIIKSPLSKYPKKYIFLKQMETIRWCYTFQLWRILWKALFLNTLKNIFLQQMEYLTLTAVWADEIAPSNCKWCYQKPLF